MIKIFALLAIITSSLYGQISVIKTSDHTFDESVLEDQEKEYRYVVRQIDSLTNLKDYYMAKATRFRNRANRYQYQNGGANYPEAKKLWREADEYDNIVKRINDELEDLEVQKTELAKKIEASKISE